MYYIFFLWTSLVFDLALRDMFATNIYLILKLIEVRCYKFSTKKPDKQHLYLRLPVYFISVLKIYPPCIKVSF